MKTAVSRLWVVAAAVGLILPAAGHGQTAFPSAGGAPAGAVLKHEPVFGLGPQTIWKGGFGMEIQGEISRWRGQLDKERLALHAQLIYGLTKDLSLSVAVPMVQRESESGLAPGGGQIDRDATGVGDVVVRAKWRIFHSFRGATQYHVALIGGVKLPVASRTAEPALGSGSTDFLGGATVSRDGLRYYLWTSVVGKVNGKAFGRRRGNEYRYDAAVGFRPWIPAYTGVDPLLLLEFNGLSQEQNVVDGFRSVGTGGTILALSPGFWLTHRNHALKGGVKVPVYQNLGFEEAKLAYTAVLSFEVHL